MGLEVIRGWWARAPEARPEHGRQARSKLPASSLPTSAQLLLQAAKATEILTTSNFLQEPHTGGEKIPQAFPMKSFPQALPTPRASWLGPGPPPATSLLGVQHPPRLRALSCLKPLTSPRNVFLPLHKAPLFFPCLNLKLLSVLPLPVWGGVAGAGEREGGRGSRTSGSLFTLVPLSLFLLHCPRGGAAVDREFSEPPGSRGAL